MKNLEKVRTIISWQVTRDHKAKTLKIDQSSFIRNLIKSKDMMDYNSINILMKKGCFIEMSKSGNYQEVDIKPYK